MTVIRVIDTETTGFEDPAGIVEIGWTDLRSDGDSWVIAEGPRSVLVNPGIPITYPAMAVHHIDEDMVRSAPPADRVLSDVLASADYLCAHNAAFDARFIRGHDLPWICTFKTARTIWPDFQGHSNGSIRYELGLCPHDDRALPSHRAGPDTWVTAHILLELLRNISVERLVEIAENPVLQTKVGFGEHYGKRWSEVPDSYLHFILHKSDMPADPKKEDVVFTARCEVKRRSSPRNDAPQIEQQGEMHLPHSAAAEAGQPEPKGGVRAQRAAIVCAERGFWAFVGVSSADEAKAYICRRCSVTSRKMLDHDERAAAIWHDIDGKYRLWLDGHDVELD